MTDIVSEINENSDIELFDIVGFKSSIKGSATGSVLKYRLKMKDGSTEDLEFNVGNRWISSVGDDFNDEFIKVVRSNEKRLEREIRLKKILDK
jgi:hypothetical protein